MFEKDSMLNSLRKKPICKEILYVSSDESIEQVHIGVFPVKGRYFRQEMIYRMKGCFELTVSLPKGKSFMHYYLNRDFSKPVNSELTMLSVHDTQKRSPLVLETEVFCPVQFEDSASYINHIKDDLWEIRAITHQHWIKGVCLMTLSDQFELKKHFTFKNKSYWRARVRLKPQILHFCLCIYSDTQTKYLHRNFKLENALQEFNLMAFNLGEEAEESRQFSTLGTGYQILPDRFHRATGNKTEHFLEEWGAESGHFNFFGGNLTGIKEKLGYVSALGAEFIYLNPVFLSGTYHRYDCTDYRLIDPMLGSEIDFSNLVEDIHQRGMKLILDISLNHCSTNFFAFRDIIENGIDSKYLDWFEIYSFPLFEGGTCNYSCWHGHKELPQFNLNNPEVRQYLLESATLWTDRYGVDGWRLDVCTEIPESFVQEFVEAIRQYNPASVIIGESWHFDETIFAKECKLNGMTNFSMYLDAIVPFFIKNSLSIQTLAAQLLDINHKNSHRMTQHSWNFLSNHDLPRLYSVISDKQHYRLALALLFSLPGTPVVYYGEEIPLEGQGDPLNRRCMEFQLLNESGERYDIFIAALNRIRFSHKLLFESGDLSFPTVIQKEKVLVLERCFEKESIYFCFNFCNTSLKEEIHFKEIHLPANSVQILYAENITQEPMVLLSTKPLM